MKKNKINDYLISIILFFFVIINFVYFFLNFNSLIDLDNYSYNELFINYQGGLIRRGFLGEIFWQLNNKFSFDPKYFFSILFFINYLIQVFLLIFLLKKYLNHKLLSIFIIFSPSLVLFHIYSPELYYLKDGIIKTVILLHAFIFYKFIHVENNNIKYFCYLKFLIIPILFFVILNHEYQIFSISVHFLISLGAINKKK